MEKLKQVLDELTDIIDQEEFKYWEMETHWKDPNHTGALEYVQGRADGLRFAQGALTIIKEKYGLLDDDQEVKDENS